MNLLDRIPREWDVVDFRWHRSQHILDSKAGMWDYSAGWHNKDGLVFRENLISTTEANFHMLVSARLSTGGFKKRRSFLIKKYIDQIQL